QRKFRETVWRWKESRANPSLLNSLFNRENTGNFFNIEGLFPQTLPDLPVLKGLQDFTPKTEQGIIREMPTF
ncbi:MAG: hypothetical protein VCE91_00970, partial [Nitrospinota bacterium]